MDVLQKTKPKFVTSVVEVEPIPSSWSELPN
jgi:hypothetical protein